MHFRIHNIQFLIFTLLIFCLLSDNTFAQNREQRTTRSGQVGTDFGRNLFIDEMGIQLSIERFYEGYLDINSYRLGTGDLLGIFMDGNVSGVLKGLRVNSQGVILIPEIGIISVGGMLFHDAEELIGKAVESKLPGTVVQLILDHPRTIKVHITGNVPFPGPQLVLAQTRLDQAIYRSFFQSELMEEPVIPEVPETGVQTLPPFRSSSPDFRERESNVHFRSVPVPEPASPIFLLANKYPYSFIKNNPYALRNISIQRSDGTVVKGDLVRYLTTGDKEANPIVQQDDIITIHSMYEYAPRVSISGAVNHSLDLEFRPGDSISQILHMAGGITFDAKENSIRVIQATDQGPRELVLTDDSAIAEYEIQPNDRLIIPIDRKKRASQSVEVHGEVQYTGRYPIKNGETTLYELLRISGGLTDMALPQAAYLERTKPGKTEFATRPAFDARELIRTSDQFTQGFEYLDLEAQLAKNRVSIDLSDEQQLRKIRLFDGDLLHVPRNDGTIFVFGQVNLPGYYEFESGLIYDDYINNAGGFALAADHERVFIIKARSSSWHSATEATIEPGDLIFIDRVPIDEFQASRSYEIQKRAQRTNNLQLIVTTISVVASAIITYVVITQD